MEAAQKEYESLRSQYPGFCGCEICHGDVMVYALNRLSPHYVSTRAGEIITGLTMGTDQETAKLTVILIEGFRRVALAPRCGAKPVNLQ
jgi:hypothetical protein